MAGPISSGSPVDPMNLRPMLWRQHGYLSLRDGEPVT